MLLETFKSLELSIELFVGNNNGNVDVEATDGNKFVEFCPKSVVVVSIISLEAP